MKPGKLTSPIILRQPWQHTHNGVPNWRREGINFEIDSARLFTPFMDEESVSSDSEDKDEPKDEVVQSIPQVPAECQKPLT